MLHLAHKPSEMLQQAISPLRTLMLAQSVVLDSAGLPPRSVLLPACTPPSALTMTASSGDVGRSAGTSAMCLSDEEQGSERYNGGQMLGGEAMCSHTYLQGDATATGPELSLS